MIRIPILNGINNCRSPLFARQSYSKNGYFLSIAHYYCLYQNWYTILLSSSRLFTISSGKENNRLIAGMPYPAKLQSQPNFSFYNKPAWKEAASLIILAANDNNETSSAEFDYKLLMVKRSSRSSFFASAFVFPGGQVELSDFDLKWYQLFENCGFQTKLLDKISKNIVGPRPPIITDPITLKNNESMTNIIHMDLGLRISAIRETFEEAGILIVTDQNNSDSYCQIHSGKSLNFDLEKWQKLVRSDSDKFFQLCQMLKMVPNVWALFEWSNWLTPVNVGHKRFDTIFYICCFPQRPQVFVDNAEVTQPIWCNPKEILEQHQSEQVFLAPPQVYELSRILQFQQLDRFKIFMKTRESLGTQRWLPIIYTYDDGALSFVPGDENYPQEPELIAGNKTVAEKEGSVNEANQQSKHLNRMELQGIRCRTLCNIEPGCGHLPPITYSFQDEKPMAKL